MYEMPAMEHGKGVTEAMAKFSDVVKKGSDQGKLQKKKKALIEHSDNVPWAIRRYGDGSEACE
jgi:hypothetical protein